ncbi:MAG: DUF3499 domain-containing protein [Micrococcaceae bacterium]|uniref:DUF3499 domain-containing protein n=1 Tax=Yaniella flava TaxID=287930 RepID=UPI0017FADC82|nr:DUF3499 domain-containing protein [Micrococcaceae bacterium]
MGTQRICTKTACSNPAAATLTFNYAESTVVLGPMSQRAEPHAHDLCAKHAQQFTAPVGWEFLRLTAELDEDTDDLLAVANAVNAPEDEDEPADASSGTIQQVDRSVAPTRPELMAEQPNNLRLLRPE